MKIKERGYFTIETVEGAKIAHFSRTFLTTLRDIAGEDIVSLGKKMTKEQATELEMFDYMALLFHAGLNAYALETDSEITWNEYKVANWLWDAMSESDKVGAELMEALNCALPKPSKSKGVKGK